MTSSLPQLAHGAAAGGANEAAQQEAEPEVDITKASVQDLQSVEAYIGFDLQKEEEEMQSSYWTTKTLPPANPLGVDRSRMQDFVNMPKLRNMIRSIGEKHGVRHVDNDTLAYIALAARERATNLLEKMVEASKHRVGILLDRTLEESNEALSSGQLAHIPSSADTIKFSISVQNDIRRVIQLAEYFDREEDQRERTKLHPDGSGKSAFEEAKERALEAQAAGADPSDPILAPLHLGQATMLTDGADGVSSFSGMSLDGTKLSEKEPAGGTASAAAGTPGPSTSGKPGKGGDKPKKPKKPKKSTMADVASSEAIKVRQTNSTLKKALGSRAIKSWMLPQGAEGAANPMPKKKKVKDEGGPSTGEGVGSTSNLSEAAQKKAAEEEAALSRLAKVGVYTDDAGREVRVLRPMTVREMTRVTLRDALFCLEGEQQMAKSPILFKWMSKII
ncbi:hypothetical protein HDU96_004252 [Phlyctochytrium bullatum]|nr:hypothetical protein HDU96_004252 [Phlyctochytrium bullatum]